MYYPNVETLLELEKQGYLKSQKHPTKDLTIWNYSRTCQFENYWTQDTINCRGLIISGSKLIARGFPKFFNWQEVYDKIPKNESFDCYEKLDGSLILLYWDGLEWEFASKGSFQSEQAKEARKIWDEKYSQDISSLDKNYTYLFEVIYPENQIVIRYGERKLVFLARINVETGEEIRDISRALTKGTPSFEGPKKYSFNSFEEAKKAIRDREEGYVITFESGFRCKIKFDEYVLLHKIITNCSNVSIWEALSKGENLEQYLENTPDEFDRYVRETRDSLEIEYQAILSKAKSFLPYLSSLSSRKEQAIWIRDNIEKSYHSIIFLLLDNNDPSQLIWKLIRPIYARPFYTEEL